MKNSMTSDVSPRRVSISVVDEKRNDLIAFFFLCYNLKKKKNKSKRAARKP